MTEFVLVSCSKSKQSGIHRAGDLYEPSRIFRVRREVAQERGDYWGVLSAKHGYLRPWDVVEEYERHITDRTEIWGAFALEDLLRDLEDLGVDTVTVLAGSKYVEPLVTELEAAGYDVIDYNSGLRPGERYSKLKSDLQPGEQQKLVPDGGHERPEHEIMHIFLRLEKVEQELKESGSEHHRKMVSDIRADLGDLLLRAEFDEENE